MKPPIAPFDVAIYKLPRDTKNAISVRCANMTLFAWTLTDIYIICVPTRNRNNEFILDFILREIKMADFER